MSRTTEAFSRVKIDALLKDAGWNLTDGVSVLFEQTLPDGSRADYALCDRAGRPLAALEAKRASIRPRRAHRQGHHYAEQLGVPFVFLSNGEEVWFLDREIDAHARKIATFLFRGRYCPNWPTLNGFGVDSIGHTGAISGSAGSAVPAAARGIEASLSSRRFPRPG